MSDDRFEAWVHEAAKDYNRPPDIVPRDTMWDEIESRAQSPESRGEKLLGFFSPRSALPGSPVRAPRAGIRTRLRAGALAAAAIVLVAVGIGLGYWIRGGSTTDQIARVPGNVAPTPVRDTTTTGSPTRLVNSDSSRPGIPADRSSAAAVTPTSGYDVLAVQHFTATEALFVSFRAAPDTTMDEATRRWSRDLLSTTRLLLDSPAANDQRRRRLLEDLELILIQMAQLPAQDATLDRQLIDRAIARRQLLTRIRTSIPAGFPSGT